MKLSTSSLNTLTKCGYKYYLTKVRGLTSTDRRKANILFGQIVGDAVQEGRTILNVRKEITPEEVAGCLIKALEARFVESDIPTVVLPALTRLLVEGIDEPLLHEIDSLAHTLNYGPIYEYVPKAPLKKGGISKDKKKPPLSMKIVYMYEDLLWALSPENPTYKIVRDAGSIEHEKNFEVPLHDPYTNMLGEVEQDHIVGRFDTICYTENGPIILEDKYTTSRFTQDLVDKNRQVVTYNLALNGECTVILLDIAGHAAYVAEITPSTYEATKMLYQMARKQIHAGVFLPTCGTDPYTEGSTLCEFKCTEHCPFTTTQGATLEAIDE